MGLGYYLQYASVLCVGIGTLALFGWIFNVPAWTRLLPFQASMKPLTAVCIICSALALWLRRKESDNVTRERSGIVLGLAVVILSGLIMLEYVFNINLGLDLFFFKQAVLAENILNPGRPAPTTVFCLLFLGLAILSIRRSGWLISLLTMPVMLVSLLAIIGYAYDVNALYAIGVYNSMAFSTALLLFLLDLGVLAASPRHPLTATFISDLAGGGMVRWLLFIAVLAPFLLGWLQLQGELLGWYDPRFGLALFASSNIVVAVVLIFWSASLLNQSDEKRETSYAVLAEHRSQLAGILDSAMDAIITVDNDQKIIMFNSAAEQMFDYRAKDLIEKNIDVLLPERYRLIHREHIVHFGNKDVMTRAMGAARPISGVRANGEEFPIEASISQINFRGRKLFTVILRDISERVKAADELKSAYLSAHESQIRLTDIIGSAMDGIITIDSDQKIVMFNSAAERMFGYQADRIIDQPLESLLPERYRATHKKHILRFGEKGKSKTARWVRRVPLAGCAPMEMNFRSRHPFPRSRCKDKNCLL